MTLTAERLRSRLRYDPLTGQFFWLARGQGVPDPSREAGRVNSNGYREICVDLRLYSAQRLAWLYMTGSWPAGDVDHEDTARANNRWANLREATKAQNQANSRVRKSNTSGFKGVHFGGGRWQAQIRINGKKVHLGCFDTPEAASGAYERALLAAHGEFGRVA